MTIVMGTIWVIIRLRYMVLAEIYIQPEQGGNCLGHNMGNH